MVSRFTLFFVACFFVSFTAFDLGAYAWMREYKPHELNPKSACRPRNDAEKFAYYDGLVSAENGSMWFYQEGESHTSTYIEVDADSDTASMRAIGTACKYEHNNDSNTGKDLSWYVTAVGITATHFESGGKKINGMELKMSSSMNRPAKINVWGDPNTNLSVPATLSGIKNLPKEVNQVTMYVWRKHQSGKGYKQPYTFTIKRRGLGCPKSNPNCNTGGGGREICPPGGCAPEDPPPTSNLKKFQIIGRTYSNLGDNKFSTHSKNGDSAQKIEVGQTGYFKHTLESRGDNDNGVISWKVKQEVFGFDGNLESSSEVQRGVAIQKNGIFHTSVYGGFDSKGMRFIPTIRDARKTFCQSIEFSPSHKNMSSISDLGQFSSGGGAETYKTCFYVSHDYNPKIENPVGGKANCALVSCNAEVEAGVEVEIPPRVTIPDSGSDVEWKLTHFVVAPDSKIPARSSFSKYGVVYGGGFVDHDSDPCSSVHFSGGSGVYGYEDSSKKIRRCSVISGGRASGGKTHSINFTLSGENANRFLVPESADIGMKYCFAISINPGFISSKWTIQEQKDRAKEWRHDAPYCVIVVKKPKTQVLGGGIFAKGEAKGLTSFRGRKYGSWSEYELMLGGSNVGVGSNGIYGYKSKLSPNQSNLFENRLTFANRNSSFGNFGSVNFSISDFISKMRSEYGSLPVDSSDISGGIHTDEHKVRSNSDIRIGDIDYSRDIVVYAPNHNITISGNITQSGVRSFGQISRAIIIAKNINIEDSVNRIDALLVAESNIDTCSNVATLRNSFCGGRLNINGAVVSGGNLRLRRTAGSVGGGDGIGEPAEVISSNADMYWAIFNRSQSSGALRTTHTKELPVRY